MLDLSPLIRGEVLPVMAGSGRTSDELLKPQVQAGIDCHPIFFHLEV